MEYIQSIKTDIFLKRYAIYFSGSMVVAFLNYLFHPVIGRMLSPSDFGDIQALLSLIAQTGVVFSAFSVVVVNLTANLDDSAERNAIISELQKISIYIVIGAVILILVLLSSIREFLNLSSLSPLLGLAVFLPLSAAVTFRNAYLQGSGRFTELSIGGVISSAGRLILAMALIVLGLGLFGTVLGMVLAQVGLFVYLFYKTRRSLHINLFSSIHVLEKGRIIKEINYGFLVLFSTALVTIMYTSDVLIVKHYFNAHDAGIYSGISAVAKVVFFLVAPVAAVLLASVKLKQDEGHNRKILWKSLGIAGLIGIAILSTFYIFHDMVVKVLIGDNYLSLAHILPKVALVMLLSAIVNILVFYFLALRRYLLVFLSITGITLLAVLVVMNHESINGILNAMTLSLVSIIVLLVIIYAKDHFSRRPSI